jgi:hypothetical protein
MVNIYELEPKEEMKEMKHLFIKKKKIKFMKTPCNHKFHVFIIYLGKLFKKLDGN